MRLNLVYVLQISVAVGIPEFGPAAGKYRCHTDDWHYATSFYVSDDINKAFEKCEKHDCDLIVEWTRKSRSHMGKTYTGYDIGKYNVPACPQHKDMTAIIKYEKSHENYMNSSNTITGLIN